LLPLRASVLPTIWVKIWGRASTQSLLEIR
jgi:hypothetical protein